ncbi:hypothetical protein CDV55_103532 [Aspergillus turcosus]|uniref:Uncharacterized protein n=1 Tax=Aspergillus turcosus TaxID=1245748 RepID=A0A397HIP0_9EURO|nr:hypothetical protein CDV55_103532 [Aspergillus turcosus]RLL97295.1 hypothetical protein CFD26_103887 [Aspergillus turcosus]
MKPVPASARTKSVTSHDRKKDHTIWDSFARFGIFSTSVSGLGRLASKQKLGSILVVEDIGLRSNQEENEPLCRSRLDLILITAIDVRKPGSNGFSETQHRPLLLKLLSTGGNVLVLSFSNGTSTSYDFETTVQQKMGSWKY